MDFRQLEVFSQVAELESFSRAAKALGLTQPTASEHIRTLEEEIGAKLFDRLGRSVKLTQAGAVLLPHALQLLQARREATGAVEDFLGIVRGRLDVGASTIPGGYLLPRLLGKFKKSYPESTIRIECQDSRRVVEGVLEGRFEVGVTGARISNDQLVYRLFAKDDLVLTVHPEHPLAGHKTIRAAQLREVKMIVREEGSGTRSETEARLSKLGVRIQSHQIAAVLGDAQAVRAAVRAGVGAAIVSRVSVEEDFASGALLEVEIKGFTCSREFFTVVHKARSLSPLAREFLAYLHGES